MAGAALVIGGQNNVVDLAGNPWGGQFYGGGATTFKGEVRAVGLTSTGVSNSISGIWPILYLNALAPSTSATIVFQGGGSTEGSISNFGNYLNFDGVFGLHFRTGGADIGVIDASGFGLKIGALGYRTGAGGTVVQATSKSTGVTLNKSSGQVTMNAAALAAAGIVSFTVTNSQVAATDTISLNLQSGNATAGTYRYWIDKVAAGSFVVCVENRSAGSLSEALVLNFNVFKGANS